MWEKSESGRELFDFTPKVNHKEKNCFETVLGENIVTQVRTGYVRVNEYLNKTKITRSNLCHCGSVESASHFLLNCQLYKMRGSK